MEVIWQLLIEEHWPIVFKRIHLLETLHFLKCYPLQDIGASFCQVDHKTWHKWVWLTIIALYHTLHLVIINYKNYLNNLIIILNRLNGRTIYIYGHIYIHLG